MDPEVPDGRQDRLVEEEVHLLRNGRHPAPQLLDDLVGRLRGDHLLLHAGEGGVGVRDLRLQRRLPRQDLPGGLLRAANVRARLLELLQDLLQDGLLLLHALVEVREVPAGVLQGPLGVLDGVEALVGHPLVLPDAGLELGEGVLRLPARGDVLLRLPHGLHRRGALLHEVLGRSPAEGAHRAVGELLRLVLEALAELDAVVPLLGLLADQQVPADLEEVTGKPGLPVEELGRRRLECLLALPVRTPLHAGLHARLPAHRRLRWRDATKNHGGGMNKFSQLLCRRWRGLLFLRCRLNACVKALDLCLQCLDGRLLAADVVIGLCCDQAPLYVLHSLHRGVTR
mmetsp:Transcript_21706/g.59330  ORF Transcript_21706/g.59330 Transcript_21706/m.59330 type:complete len:342 (-) Transcript_21706:238-1263(-)